MITVVIFIADYLLRLFTADFKYPELKGAAFIRYPFSFMAIIDLLSILPSFGVLNPGLKIFKILRLVRTLRVLKSLKALKTFRALKFFRYSRSVELIVEVIKAQKEPLITVGGMAVGYILIAALIVFNVEPESFHTFFDAVYWACVSLTTVGYGDIYPVSTAGRIVTMLISLKPVCSAFSVLRNIPVKMFIIGLPTRCRRLSMKAGDVHAACSIHWKDCSSAFTMLEVPSRIRQVWEHVEPEQA